MRLFTPNTSSLNSFEEKGKYLMAWRINIVFAVLFLLLIPITIAQPIETTIIFSLTATISIVLSLYLKRTKKFKMVFLTYTTSGTIFALYSLNFITNVTHYAEIPWIFLIIILAFVSINKVTGWIFLIINLIGISAFILFNLNTHIEVIEVQDLPTRIASIVEFIAVFLSLGYVVNQYIKFQNYSKDQLEKSNYNLEQQNDAVLTQNKENITLIKEVHHRVKNNLQIIISLLRMQRSEIESEENKEQFSIAINRVMTMSMIHQKLYQEKEPSRINVIEYINDLVNELISVANRKVELVVESGEEYAGLKTIVPFGLLVNELISNSLKHAYSENENAIITIEIKPKSAHEIFFKYSDNGEWIEPKESDINSFGLELIEVLTEQLDGTYTREGSSYTFEISTRED